MKRIFAAALLICLVILSGCNAEDAPKSYRNDLTPQAISDACAPAISSYSLLTAADEDYIRFRLMLDETMMESCVVYIQNAGTSIDEFGIIKSRTDYTEAVESAVADYLARRVEEWTGQYMVEEFPKLQAANYKTFGSYTVYTILSEDDKEILYPAVSNMLAEK